MSKKEEESQKVEGKKPEVMGEYAAMYADAKADGRTESLTPEYFEFKQPGNAVVGKFIAANPVKSTLSDGTYNQYLFDTDQGLIKFSLGGAADAEVAPMMYKNHVYYIQFEGQMKISNKRRVNKYLIEHIDTGEAVPVGGADDQPF